MRFNLKNGLKKTSTSFKIRFLMKICIMVTLCRVHNYTSYMVGENISNALYLSERIFVRMSLLLSTYFAGILILYDILIFVDKCLVMHKNNIIPFRNIKQQERYKSQ